MPVELRRTFASLTHELAGTSDDTSSTCVAEGAAFHVATKRVRLPYDSMLCFSASCDMFASSGPSLSAGPAKDSDRKSAAHEVRLGVRAFGVRSLSSCSCDSHA